jgi:hypothetical protein
VQTPIPPDPKEHERRIEENKARLKAESVLGTPPPPLRRWDNVPLVRALLIVVAFLAVARLIHLC